MDDPEETEISYNNLIDDINRLLDEVHRPVGSLDATLPDSPAARRALIALYDAIGRNL